MILAAWYHPILATIFAFMAVVLMGVILLQRGRGVGLAGAFGGVGGHTAFGAKTGDFLTWATIVIASVFLCYVVILNYVFVPLKAAGTSPPPPAMPAPVPAPAGSEEDQTGAPTENGQEHPGPPAVMPERQSEAPGPGAAEELPGTPSEPAPSPEGQTPAPAPGSE